MTYDNEDHELILTDGDSVKQNKSSYDPGRPDAIKNQITQTFKIPDKINKKIFEYLGLKGGGADFLSKDVTGRLVQDSQISMNKAAVLVTKGKKSYNLNLRTGNNVFFDQIKGSTINDLDFSDIEELWTLDNIIANNGNTEGLIYGLINWGVLSTHNTYFEANELFPLVFVKTLFDKIFDSDYNSALTESWSYAGDIFGSADFTNKVVTVRPEIIDEITENLKANKFGEPSFIVTAPSYVYVDSLANGGSDVYGCFQLIDWSGASPPYGGAADPAYGYVCQKKGTYSITISGNISTSPTSDPTFILTTADLGTGWPGGAAPIPHTPGAGFLPFSVDVQIDLDFGDEVLLHYWGAFPTAFSITDSHFEVTNIALDDEYVQINAVFPYPISGNLPEMNQVDLVKEIMQMFSLIAVPDTDSRTITFEKYEKLNDNYAANNVNDLTSKLDASKGVTNKFNYRSLGKTNWFRWAKDSDDNLQENSGETSFELEGINYIGEKDFVESAFAYSRPYVSNSLYTIPEIKLLEIEDSAVVIKNSYVPRIYDLNSQSGSVEYRDGATIETETDDLPYVDLVDWANLKTDYWTSYILVLDNPDNPTMYFFLSVDDFANFDFFKPVFIEGWGYYVAYGIKGFRNKVSVPINLIRLG